MDRPNSRVVPQVAIESPPIQPCIMFLGTNYDDGLHQLATHNGY